MKGSEKDMINFFTGRPGNGKSLHMAMIIYAEMKKGKNTENFKIRLFKLPRI